MVRYRQTVLGAAWTVLQPILLMAVFTIFFGLLGRLGSDGLPFPVFYLLGLLPWQMVSRTLTEGTTTIVMNGAIIQRVYFPRVYFPIATALASLVDLVFGFVALGVLLLIYRILPSWHVIAIVPLAAIALAAGLGVTLWTSSLNAAYRDVSQLLPSLTQTWFFASPVIYPSSIVPTAFRALYYVNPMAVVIDGFRWAIAGAPAPPVEAYLVGGAMAIFLLLSGYVFFRKRESTFADVV